MYYVDASTHKLGEWAERWDSCEPCTGGTVKSRLSEESWLSEAIAADHFINVT